MLHVVRNMTYSDNILVRDGLRELERRLPSGWRVGKPEPARKPIDAITRLTAPDRRTGRIALDARTRLDPKGVLHLAEPVRDTGIPLIVVSPYLSEATRSRLLERDLSFLDLTGNMRISIAKPGLFIETYGATEDPNRQQRPARSLRGAKAGRIVRALVDQKRLPGVRELAAMTSIDPGYVSRVLAFLDSEALITRVGRGQVQSVDWPALLRRWAQEAPLEKRGRMQTYLEPRGINAIVERLGNSKERYAITGTLASAALAPVAAGRLLSVWIADATEAAIRLALRPTDAGANVLLIEPDDEGVFDGTIQRDRLWYAAPSQTAADLLTSPGRGPNEGEELIGWMIANESAWRR